MKGVFVHNQLEFRLESAAEEFYQGDSFPCTVSVKNHSTSPQSIADLRFELALGDIKSVREKKEDAFEVISSAELKLPWEIGPGQQQSLTWTFQLDKNCPITDNTKTLYLIYGTTSGVMNQMPISILAHAHIQAILRTLDTVFQFVLKGQKSSKGWLNAKFKPPTSRRFSMVTELTLGFHFEGTSLVLRYVFGVKKLDTGVLSVSLKKEKTEVEQQLEEGKYLLPGGYLNHEAIDASIEEALKVVATEL